MNNSLKIAGLVVGGLILVGGGAAAGTMIARAQAPAPVIASFAGPNGWMAAYHDQVVASLAKSFDMTSADLTQELQSGKTLAQVAQEKNISQDKLNAAILQAETDALAQAVEDGKLTQAQSDQLLAVLKQHPGMAFGLGFGMGPGMMTGPRGNRNFGNNGRGPSFVPGYGPNFGPRNGGQPPFAQPTPTTTPQGQQS